MTNSESAPQAEQVQAPADAQEEQRDLGLRYVLGGALAGVALVAAGFAVANRAPDGQDVHVDVHQIEEMVGVNPPAENGMGLMNTPSNSSPADLPAQHSNYIRL